jgi:hypothetical protein
MTVIRTLDPVIYILISQGNNVATRNKRERSEMKMRKNVRGITYNYKNDLKDSTCFISSPIRVTKESSHKREDVNSSSPFANIVGGFCVILSYHPCQEYH